MELVPRGVVTAGLWAALLLPGPAMAVKPANFQIPYMPEAPAIDGSIGQEEWHRASALTGGVARSDNNRNLLSERQAVYWFGWDEESLYLAVRSLHRPGTPFQFEEDAKGEHLEIGFFPFESRQLNFPYRLRFSGADVVPCDISHYFSRKPNTMDELRELGDVMVPVFERFPRPEGWESGVVTASRVIADPDETFGSGTLMWELEARIPRATFDIDAPNAAGDAWRFLLVRNTRAPQMQVHLPVADGFFAARGFVQATLTRDAPSVQLREVTSVLKGEDRIALRYHNPTGEAVTLTTEIRIRNAQGGDVLYEALQEGVIPAGAVLDRDSGAVIDGVRDGPVYRLELLVKGQGARPLLSYQAEFKVDQDR